MKLFNKEFDFDFFGRKKAEKIKVLENALAEEIADNDKNWISEPKKVYKNIIYTNGIITVIFNDGSVISAKKDVSLINLVEEAETRGDIINLLRVEDIKCKNEDKESEVLIIQKFIEYETEVLELLGEDFTCKGTNFYYKNISYPINSLILNSLIEHKKSESLNEYQALLSFFLKLCLNPLEESRNDLYKVIKEYDVKLTNTGNFLGYRSVWKVAEDTELLEYVSEQYFKKKRHKKSPNNYSVYTSDDFEGLKTIKTDKIFQMDFQNRNNQVVGNLNDLYLSLQKSDDNRYTDDYTKKQDIRIGSVYKLPETFNLDNKGSCGGALHLSMGADAYNYTSFGDTQVIAIVNPMFVYRMDTGCGGKIGVKQMFIAAKEDESNITEQLVHFDEIYHNETIEELENALKDKSFNTLSVEEEVPVISLVDLKQITNSLKNKIVSF